MSSFKLTDAAEGAVPIWPVRAADLEHWRAGAKDDQNARRLAFRAVVALQDDELTPVLEEIYAAHEGDRWSLREFYWTIRPLKGPKVLKLRKRIRDEVGMNSLR